MTVAPLPYFHDGVQFPPTYVGDRWLTLFSTVARFHPDLSSGGASLTGLNEPYCPRVVGTEVWVPSTYDSKILRYSKDGASLGTITVSGGYYKPLVVVPNVGQAWTASIDTNIVKRFNYDTTSAGTDITGAVLEPNAMTLVGTDVWIANTNGASIRVIHADGSLGALMFGNGMTGASRPQWIEVVNSGAEVWVVFAEPSGTDGIARYHPDGTSAGSKISLPFPIDVGSYPGRRMLADDGTQVWFASLNGLVCYSYSGTVLATIGTDFYVSVVYFAPQVWAVNNNTLRVERYKTDRTSAGSSASVADGHAFGWVGPL